MKATLCKSLTKAQVVAAFDGATSLKQVGKKLGCSPIYANYLRRSKGIPPRLARRAAWNRDELAVCSWLQRRGLRPERSGYGDPHDIICRKTGMRVEVKSAKLSHGFWKFNIHRHGKLNESQVDAYILRLNGIPFSKNAIHLILPSPLRRYTINISLRSLLTIYAKYFNEFKYLNGNGRGRIPKESA